MNTKPTHVVEAAGGIPYRWKPGCTYRQVEVCLIHRPKYDDWSWPKGKVEPNESIRHAAVREIEEESGIPVALGPLIGEEEYPLGKEGQKGKNAKSGSGSGKSKSNLTKHITYWMAEPISTADSSQREGVFGPVAPAKTSEIDGMVWLTVPKARKRLTHALDRGILDQFVSRIKDGFLQARPLIVVRHGKAEPRKHWNGTDANRPITPAGAAASYAVTRDLACFAPTRLVSSPWLRCMETIAPYSWHTGMNVTTADELTEEAFGTDPDAMWHAVEREINGLFAENQESGATTGTDRAPGMKHAENQNAHTDTCTDTSIDKAANDKQHTPHQPTRHATALCMHRPVIGGLFEHLRGMCTAKSLAKQLVAKSPYMATSNAVVLFLIPTENGPRIVDIQRMAPLVY